MSASFSRSLRTLDADSIRRTSAVFVLTLGLLGAWLVWLTASRVTVYASTEAARLEVDRENHPVGVAVGGRVEAVHVTVGQLVRAGDVLLEFDAVSERLARVTEQARLAPAASQVALLREELAAEERALEGERRSTEAAAAQAEAESQRARDFEEGALLEAAATRPLIGSRG